MQPISPWIISGLMIMIMGLLGYYAYTRRLAHIPRRMRKRWGLVARRYTVLKYLSISLYGVGLIGALVAMAIMTFVVVRSMDPARQPKVTYQVSVSPPNPNDVLKAVNAARKARHLQELTVDSRLTAVAQERLRDMVKNQYYAHKSPAGLYYYDLFKADGFSTGFSCENLDLEVYTNVSQYVADWLASKEGHRECMLNAEVTKAGYAAGKFSDIDTNGKLTSYYLVVAIHAAPPFENVSSAR